MQIEAIKQSDKAEDEVPNLPIIKQARFVSGRRMTGIVFNDTRVPDGTPITTTRVCYGPDTMGLMQTLNTLYRVEMLK